MSDNTPDPALQVPSASFDEIGIEPAGVAFFRQGGHSEGGKLVS
jgi:hypothetical protein